MTGCRSLLHPIIDREGCALPKGYDSWALKSVRPDLSTSYGFKWPWPGGVAVSNDHLDIDNASSCPSRQGDGLCVATSWQGMASAGFPARTLLLVAYKASDVCGRDRSQGKIRVSGGVAVAAVVDGERLLREVGEDAKLTGANLIGANLRGANLEWADLDDALLDGADLRYAYLIGARLTKAHLVRTGLRGARMTNARLYMANLTGADLTDADLADADLTGADLADADLTGAYLAGADLTGAYLTGANLAGANLTGTKLRGASLTGADLDGAKGADLTGTFGTPR